MTDERGARPAPAMDASDTATRRAPSLRGRVLRAVGIATVAIWCVAGWALLQHLRATVDEIFDAHLADAANGLHAVLLSEAEEHGASGVSNALLARVIEHEVRGHAIGPRFATDHGYRVRFGDTYEFASATAPPWRSTTDGFSTDSAGRVPRRFYAITRASPLGRLRVEVSEPLATRSDALQRASLLAGGALLAGLPVVLGVLAFAVRLGVAPLASAAARLEHRSIDDAAAIDLAALPREFHRVAIAFDLLLQRLREARERERRFLADAAHELRTPIAALKIAAQLAERASTDAQRDEAIARVARDADRAARLTVQLLDLARAEQRAHDRDASCAVARAIDAVLHDVEPLRASRRAAIYADVTPDLRVGLSADDAEALLRNLVDNALRHGRDGGRIEIDWRADGDATLLSVEDDGPGIAEDAHARARGRFGRVGDTTVRGSGLGLSIVDAIVRAAGGEMHLGRAALGGLAVHVRLPRAPIRPDGGPDTAPLLMER